MDTQHPPPQRAAQPHRSQVTAAEDQAAGAARLGSPGGGERRRWSVVRVAVEPWDFEAFEQEV